MKKMELNQMENLNGGKLKCSDAISLSGVVLVATGATPLGWMGVAALMLMCE
jgi:hypothetical protein